MALRRKKKRNLPANRSVLLRAIAASLIVAAILWVIGFAAAMGLHLEAAQELIRDHLILPEVLAVGETLVLILLDDISKFLRAVIIEVTVLTAAVSVFWLIIAGLYQPTGPAKARRLFIIWFAGLALAGFGAGLLAFVPLQGNPDIRPVVILDLAIISGLSSMLLYWLVGSLLATPRINRPAVPMSARLI